MKYAPNITPRHLRFDHSPISIQKYWHQTDIATYHFNALALFLPILEKLVVLSLKKSLPRIESPTLKAEVSSLITQEAIHGREFEHYNQAVISPFYSIRTEQFSLRFFRLIAGGINKLSSSFHYALSAAGEHFTAIAAEIFLRDPRWIEGANPTLSAIWRWHCIEEIEHQSVAFDVFKYFKGHYLFRITAMLLMTLVFAMLYVKPIWVMIKEDKKQWDLRFYRRMLGYYWGKKGLCRALLKPYLRYYHPHFHPSKQNNGGLIEQWKKTLDSISPEDAIARLKEIQPQWH